MGFILYIFTITYSGFNFVQSHERIAPGVPPQHYQQPLSSSNSQNMHKISQYQIPQHQMSQHQYQVPQMQHIPQLPETSNKFTQQVSDHAYKYGHYEGQTQQVLSIANIAQEKAHIAEHLDIPMDTNKMSEQELQFHYFKMHDSDNNNNLDGCELIKSLIHWHEEGNKESNGGNISNGEEKVFKDEELVALIDPILEMDDINQDGFIDYPEFIQAQQRAASTTNHQ